MGRRNSNAVDGETLRTIQTNLSRFEVVRSTAFVPDSVNPRMVRAHLDADQYPGTVVEARLDVRWFFDGDFSVHYREVHRGDRHWQCRWDRHDNPHNDRTHFHRPPSADDAVDLDISPHLRDVIPTVVQWVEERNAECWRELPE